MPFTATEYTPQQILTLPMEKNDAEASTIGQYLTSLLHTLWVEKSGFSGKRPFGNSSWEFDIYKALIRANAVEGILDEDGYIDDVDSSEANSLIFQVISFLYKADWALAEEYREPEDWYVVYLDLNGNGNPVISDSFAIGFTEKEAKAKVEDRNKTTYSGVWTAVHIPK